MLWVDTELHDLWKNQPLRVSDSSSPSSHQIVRVHHLGCLCKGSSISQRREEALKRGHLEKYRDVQDQWPVRKTLHMFFFHRWRYSWRVFIQSNCYANHQGKMPSLLEVHGWVIRHAVSPMRRCREREVGPRCVSTAFWARASWQD